MQRIKKADRERFMSDWRKCLPAMRVERSMSLLKRNGPVLVGVYLQENRGNDHYVVIPYLHNLLRRTNFITMTLAYPLKNKKNTYSDMITVDSHRDVFPAACERLHCQTIFPLGETLTVSEVIDAYDTAISKELVLDSREKLYEDILSLLTWSGRTAEAEKRYASYVRIMSGWNDRVFVREGGKVAFFERLADLLESRRQLGEICEEQIRLLEVDTLPDYGLRCV